MPLDRRIRVLQPERDLSHSPLFQVMFNFENLPKPTPMVNGLKMAEIFVESGTSTLDLNIEAEEKDQQLGFRFHYSTELFEADTIARMMSHFQTLLSEITANPQQQLSLIPLLTEHERHQLLVEWNATQADFAANETLHSLFEQQVQRTPDVVAMVSTDQQLTYTQLNEKANQFAHYLKSFGVGRETMVAVCLERSVDLIAALLGSLKAGCVYVPLDPAYPPERLAFLLDDSQAAVLIAHQELPGFSGQAINLDRNEVLLRQPSGNPGTVVQPTDLAYMLYTSGSTGTPKGVLIEHRSLVNYIQVVHKQYDVQPYDRTLLTASPNFDGSLEEIFMPLLQGGTLVAHPDGILQSVTVFLRTCYETGITILGLATALWHEIAVNVDAEHLPYLSRLRVMALGGEPLLPEYVRTWQQKVGMKPVIVNGYGPTETTICVALGVVEKTETDSRNINVGRPIANTQFYILDQQGQPVPIGVPGELYIGGVCRARRRLPRPVL